MKKVKLPNILWITRLIINGKEKIFDPPIEVRSGENIGKVLGEKLHEKAD